MKLSTVIKSAALYGDDSAVVQQALSKYIEDAKKWTRVLNAHPFAGFVANRPDRGDTLLAAEHPKLATLGKKAVKQQQTLLNTVKSFLKEANGLRG